MSTHYYIYYRVSSSHASRAEALLEAMHDELAEACSVRGRYLKKRDEPLLWMEIYEHVAEPEAFESTLQSLLHKYAFNDVLQSGTSRHIECFVD